MTTITAHTITDKLNREISDFIKGDIIETVPCRIHGQLVFLNETQVRWLQVKANRVYKERGDREFEEFIRNHEVYSYTSAKKESVYKMQWRTDGKFSNEFCKGFYSLNSLLAFEII